MVRFAEEKDLDKVNELRKQVNDIHVEGRPDIFKAGFCQELRDFARILMNDENSDIIVAERDGIICLAWRIPGTGEPGGLPSMGSHRVEHDYSDLAAAAAAELNSQYL